MPFDRPTLTELRQIARANFKARLPGADSTLRRSNINVSADTFAGLVNGQYGYLDWAIAQFFIDTASGEYLDRWGAIYGIPRAAATKAAGNAVFTGIDDTPIPAGTVVQDNANVQFATTADGEISGTTATIAIEALNGGADGNDVAGAPLQLVSAIAGIDGSATVDGSGLSGGTDLESDNSLRERLLLRIQTPPQGGRATDYEQWAKTVPGVTRAFVYPLNRGPGTVDIAFVMDGRTNIIPTPTDVAAVQAAIDANRPVTDSSIVFAPTASAKNFTFSALSPNTADAHAAITASLADMFATDAIPGGGLSFQDQIIPAIAATAGINSFTLSSPSTDIAGVAGVIATLGTVTFP